MRRCLRSSSGVRGMPAAARYAGDAQVSRREVAIRLRDEVGRAHGADAHGDVDALGGDVHVVVVEAHFERDVADIAA